MVTVGETAMLSPVTVPTLGEMERPVAPIALQLRVVLPPAAIAAGLALNALITGSSETVNETIASLGGIMPEGAALIIANAHW